MDCFEFVPSEQQNLSRVGVDQRQDRPVQRSRQAWTIPTTDIKVINVDVIVHGL